MMVVFIFEGKSISIQCNKNENMANVCKNFSGKVNNNIDSLIFLYGGKKLDLNKSLKEITSENKINILVYKYENEICPNCGRILCDKNLDEIILMNNNINFTLVGLKNQIENIIIIEQNDINHIKSQLKNINIIINNIYEDIKK